MASMNFISSALRSVLNAVDGIVGSYGWSVVIFTLLIRLALFPLDIKSKKSMRAMNAIKPQMDALQKKYANDKEKLTQKQQELYKKSGVNPMGGCLPMLIQLPILFCMFTAMRVVAGEKTVELLLKMKQLSETEGFAGMTITDELLRENGIVIQGWLWIRNVFQPDTFWSTIIPRTTDTLATLRAVSGIEMLSEANLEAVRTFLASEAYLPFAQYFGALKTVYSAPMLITQITIPEMFNGYLILPILAGASQILSTKILGDQTTDQNAQQSNKMMQYMFPIISVWFCCTSTAAFSIYWVAANVIQILSQLGVNMYFDKFDAKNSNSQEVTKP